MGIEKIQGWLASRSRRKKGLRTEDPTESGTDVSEHPESADRNSTTGTTPNDTFVGRASGDDADAGISGAEMRQEDS
jgi:hypothetical protein